MNPIPIALTIAGSDPSGGAGIQADLKTFLALRVYGAAVPTCLTVQNTQAVADAMMLPGEFVAAQAQMVFDDLSVGALKTGMLGNTDIVEAVGRVIDGKPNIVCDPVMVSTSGYPLLNEAARDALCQCVIAQATLVTPNAHELKLLAPDIPNSTEAGYRVLQRFPELRGILIKGGHWDETGHTVTDTLLERTADGAIATHHFRHPRYQTKNTHGTGCTLAAAITAGLARGRHLSEAVSAAVTFVDALLGISAEHSVGKGHGPLLHHLHRR
ncbi:bifunctional hydroxymethylpyrimidine kinase/phosphomethylpyrimidine kinase [Chrysiogenes arsenatis]|uniref:bifunctional hydroxymethylpyrimidine kinase/phosphomethylpyrimidine kinase n=1 Tax=Chrysiogenes arsenatis TaxID=309797 RepID=UPI0004285247|nr:bifunctional hydroxymethylpyrimidine kinase/phosphomethylpyrimidine kinase [Chrysiogenes arsenatis]